LRWFAQLSTGDTVAEHDNAGEMSTWRLLKARCEREGIWIEALRLIVNGVTWNCKRRAEGYWQANLIFASFMGGVSLNTAGLHAGLAAKAVGWVQGGRVVSFYGTPDGLFHWDNPRPLEGQEQIIWAPTHRGLHGGANERVVQVDGRTWRESDGVAILMPEPTLPTLARRGV
jgi:hypothetical protein